MTTSLEVQIRHFTGSNHRNIVALSDALASENWGAFSAVVNRVSELEVTASISNLITGRPHAHHHQLGAVDMKFDLYLIRVGVIAGRKMGGRIGKAIVKALLS